MYRICTFGAYGLNKFRNLLTHDEIIYEEDMFSTSANIVASCDCNECAVFVHTLDGTVYATIKAEDEIVIVASEEKEDYEFFQRLDGELRLCCYALVIEVNNHKWRIVHE